MKSTCAFAAALVIVAVAACTSWGTIFLGAAGDGKTSIYYIPDTGEMGIQPDGHPVGLFQILSASNIFASTATLPPGGLGFDVNTAGEKAWAGLQTDAFAADFSLGPIAPKGLSHSFLLNDLSVVGSGGLGTPNRAFDLVYPGATPVEPPVIVEPPVNVDRGGIFLGAAGDGKTSIYYNPDGGEMGIQPDGQPVGLFQILSVSNIFSAAAKLPPGGLGFDVNTAGEKAWAGLQTDAFVADFSLGPIAPKDLSHSFLLNDLSVVGSGGLGTPNRAFDLVYPGSTPVVPPTVVDADLGQFVQGAPIAHQFATTAGEPPINWSNLTVSGANVPVNPPTLSATGAFGWNTSGSPLGLYNFDVTATNASGSDVGRLSVSLIAPPAVPPLVVDVNLGDETQGSHINQIFQTSAGDPPITWDKLVVRGPGALVNAPTLSPAGAFSWNSAGSPLGLYSFDVTATNAGGSDVGRLSVNLVMAPPQPPMIFINDSIDVVFPNETVVYTFTAVDPDTPLSELTWSDLVFHGAGVAIQPVFDPAAHLFTWDTTGTPSGVYSARVTVTDDLGASDTGTLFINVRNGSIPEPATAKLIALASACLATALRRRC